MSATPELESIWPEAAAVVPPRASSLGRRMVLATLVFGLLFTLCAVAVRTWSAWQSNVEAMSGELALIDQVFQRTLSKAIWEMDRDALRTQLDSASQVASVGAVTLRVLREGRAPEVLVAKHLDVTGSNRAPSIHRQLTYEPYAGASEVVGELTLVGNEQLLWARLREEAAGIVLTQAIQTLLLAGLVMWMFNRSVTVHVRYIARHLSGLTPSTLGRRLHLTRRGGTGDELSLLETGVNDLQSKLSSYLERHQQHERDLASHRDRLAELVDEQTAELRAANKRLEEVSRIDPLTGLANRRHFDELKEIEFRRAQRTSQPLTVLMCDVDHFKRYNDQYGHAQGDACLVAVAQLLRDNFARAGELVARVGGEEFAVLLPGVDLAQARVAAERLQRRMQAQAIPHEASTSAPHVTLSIGLAPFDPATMDRFDQLLRQADQALYRAKSQGRNCIAD
ncbi:GGDEF domain-containing protein [Ideonella sp.]|uniref:GGDEF domain-containing protein n=1 Tax=Ideonella sp. TaxID=1929293 RepID=UPI002B49E253|nr:diguanylate cyclase [Ideonella sp.]HJV70014.1 diguanylate cyclase [Ideonella sp.]